METNDVLISEDEKQGKEAGHITREEQLTALIDSYQNLIFSICYKMTADYFAAQDLAQETFLSAYEHLHSFDGQHEKAWLCRIATNKCIDYMSHSGRKSIPTEDIYLEKEKEGENGKTPEAICLEQESRERLLQNCNRLKPPYDEVAKAYYYDEIEVREIAAKSGKNIKTVQTQIYRAKHMLQKIYRKENSA